MDCLLGLDASIVHGSALQKEIEIRTQIKLLAREPLWIAGMSICLLAASGIVAIARSMPASDASISVEGALSEHGAAPSGSGYAHAKDPQAHLAAGRAAINRQNRTWCPECGVIESMRQIERSDDVGEQDTVEVKVAGGVSGGASGSAIAGNAITGKGYEFTVRFRDGSTTVFNEASPRTWRLGSRVIVIGRSHASND